MEIEYRAYEKGNMMSQNAAKYKCSAESVSPHTHTHKNNNKLNVDIKSTNRESKSVYRIIVSKLFIYITL